MNNTTKRTTATRKNTISLSAKINAEQFRYLSKIADKDDRPISFVVRSCIQKAMDEKWLG
ncbi:hypothetical protein [Oligella sp. MSHR50489EDL]|uniref:hypothetical protein n=1 Tax=Oligella sp. MSHR50489EDL TaxID=3139409 RepID=UPI003D8199E1